MPFDRIDRRILEELQRNGRIPNSDLAARVVLSESACLRRVRTLAERIRRFQFRDIRPKAASELPVEHASRLLGHSEKEITERVYRRLGEIVKPTK